jgi:acyl-CoA thioesterase II
LFQLEDQTTPNRFRLNVTDDLCVGPQGQVFLFGGIGHAAMIQAMSAVVGKELIWSTAQFLSYVRRDMAMNIAQATAIAQSGDEIIMTASAAFGSRPGEQGYQWLDAPEMSPPEDCVELPIWPKQAGGYIGRLEIRLEPHGTGGRMRDGIIEPTGRLKIWIRSREGNLTDIPMLAILGDFLPAGVASSLGQIGGGNSLDNTLRICREIKTDWALCDIQIAAMERGLAHGETRIFTRDGQLMALASQSLIPRFVAE